MNFDQEKYLKSMGNSVALLRQKLGDAPDTFIVLGSGLGDFTDSLQNASSLDYNALEGFFKTQVSGHEGRVFKGNIEGKSVAMLSGRIHLYEGHDPRDIVFPIRCMALWGCKQLIITNAAGSLSQELVPGTIMCIDNHINLQGTNPLVGINIDSLGTRFPDMSHPYDLDLRNRLLSACEQNQIAIHRGIYVGTLGPNYETAAEVKYFSHFGSVVGMSTISEVIAARHCGLKVLGVSLVTNFGAGIGSQPLGHEDVIAVAKSGGKKLQAALTGFLRDPK